VHQVGSIYVIQTSHDYGSS